MLCFLSSLLSLYTVWWPLRGDRRVPGAPCGYSNGSSLRSSPAYVLRALFLPGTLLSDLLVCLGLPHSQIRVVAAADDVFAIAAVVDSKNALHSFVVVALAAAR